VIEKKQVEVAASVLKFVELSRVDILEVFGFPSICCIALAVS